MRREIRRALVCPLILVWNQMFHIRYWFFGRCPPEVPLEFWEFADTARRLSAFAVGTVILSALSVCILLFTSPHRVLYAPLSLKIGGNIAVLVIVLWSRTWFRRSKRRFLARLDAAGCQHCWKCDYDLRGLPDEHQCPECGTDFLTPKQVAEWRRWAEEEGQ